MGERIKKLKHIEMEDCLVMLLLFSDAPDVVARGKIPVANKLPDANKR